MNAFEQLSDERNVISRIEPAGDPLHQFLRSEEIEPTELRPILLIQVKIQLGDQLILKSEREDGGRTYEDVEPSAQLFLIVLHLHQFRDCWILERGVLELLAEKRIFDFPRDISLNSDAKRLICRAELLLELLAAIVDVEMKRFVRVQEQQPVVDQTKDLLRVDHQVRFFVQADRRVTSPREGSRRNSR